MDDSYDCLIVGARCAGAPLAVHLARAGLRVCVVDSAKLPSDQPFSTHAILPPGMDSLDEIGVGAAIRRVVPRVSASRLAVGAAHVEMQLPPGREMYCPRRSTLDPLLAEAAANAGAEVRDETTVMDLVRDGDRVAGAVVRHRDRTSVIRARLVVGADGRNSTIARLVDAEEYYAGDTPRGGYFRYWPATAAFDALPFQTYIEFAGVPACFAFRTDGDLVIAGAFDSSAVARGWSRGDRDAAVRARLEASPVIRHLVRDNMPATDSIGLVKARIFFRAAAGKGWALVGDAGLHKDPTPGYGITDALRDAKALANAIVDGREAALEVYWRERDVLSLPLYQNANAMGSLEYGNPFNELVLSRVNASPELLDRLMLTLERELSPFEAIPPLSVLAWTASVLLRGRTDVWPHFVASVNRGRLVASELRARKRLLDVAREKLST